jgi:hypothetical protein
MVIFGLMAENVPRKANVTFVVLVHVPDGPFPRREAYVTACPTRGAAESFIRKLYPNEPSTKIVVTPMPFDQIGLNLRPGEVMAWR